MIRINREQRARREAEEAKLKKKSAGPNFPHSGSKWAPAGADDREVFPWLSETCLVISSSSRWYFRLSPPFPRVFARVPFLHRSRDAILSSLSSSASALPELQSARYEKAGDVEKLAQLEKNKKLHVDNICTTGESFLPGINCFYMLFYLLSSLWKLLFFFSIVFWKPESAYPRIANMFDSQFMFDPQAWQKYRLSNKVRSLWVGWLPWTLFILQNGT